MIQKLKGDGLEETERVGWWGSGTISLFSVIWDKVPFGTQALSDEMRNIKTCL